MKKAFFAWAVQAVIILPFLARTTAHPPQSHPVHLDNSTVLQLASKGERCGYDSKNGAVCGERLCCSSEVGSPLFSSSLPPRDTHHEHSMTRS